MNHSQTQTKNNLRSTVNIRNSSKNVGLFYIYAKINIMKINISFRSFIEKSVEKQREAL